MLRSCPEEVRFFFQKTGEEVENSLAARISTDNVSTFSSGSSSHRCANTPHIRPTIPMTGSKDNFRRNNSLGSESPSSLNALMLSLKTSYL
jgi:hypothetical protein